MTIDDTDIDDVNVSDNDDNVLERDIQDDSDNVLEHDNTPDNEPDNVPIQSRYRADIGNTSELTCPYCNATVNSKGDEFADYGSLRMHILRGHKVSLSEQEYNDVRNGDIPLPPPGKGKPKKAKKTGRAYRGTDIADVEKVDVRLGGRGARIYADQKRRQVMAEQVKRTRSAETDAYDDYANYPYVSEGFGGHRSRREPDLVEEEMAKYVTQMRQAEFIKKMFSKDEDEYGPSEELNEMREELAETEKALIQAESRADKLEQKIEFMQLIKEEVEPLKAELRDEREKRMAAERERVHPVDKLIDKATEAFPSDGMLVDELRDAAKTLKGYVTLQEERRLVRPLSEAPQRKRVVSDPDDGWVPSIFDRMMFTNPDRCDAADEEKERWFREDSAKMISYMEREMENETAHREMERIEAEKFQRKQAHEELKVEEK